MRFTAIILALLLVQALPAPAADTAGDWLDRAADAKAGARRREYAARQVLMLADSSASILIAALRGDDGADSGLRRQVAARLLGEMAVPEAEAALLEAAFDRDYFLSEAAKSALAVLYSRLSDPKIYTLLTKGARELGDIPGGAAPGEEDWLALSLRRSEYRGRFKAMVMRGLARKYTGAPAPLPEPLTWCVWDALIDIEPELRLAALEMLPHIASSQATQKLAALLYTENDPKVLTAALWTMAVMRPPQYGEAVERHVAHGDPKIAVEALAALAAMGYPGALLPLAPGQRSVAGFINHPSTPVRRRAIELLTASKNPAAVEYLSAALFDRVGANRAAAAEGLGELGFVTAVGALNPLLRDGRPEVRLEAAVALAGFGVVGIASAMVDDLQGASMPFRLAAAEALGQIGDARAIPALSEALGDANSDLACAAADALGAIGDKKAGAALYACMSENRDAVIADAARQALTALYLENPGTDAAAWPRWADRNLKADGK